MKSKDREMTPLELQKYYEEIQDTMNSQGWEYILEDLQARYDTVVVAGWKGSNESMLRTAGYLQHLEDILNLEATYEQAYEEIQLQQKLDSSEYTTEVDDE